MAIAEAAAPTRAESPALRRTTTGVPAAVASSGVDGPSTCRSSVSDVAGLVTGLVTGLTVPLLSTLLHGGDDAVEVVGLDEHVTGLRAFARSDHAAALEDVHQAAGLGEADPELALQHRGRPELRGDDQLDRLHHELEVVADVVVELPLGLGGCGDVLAVRRRELVLAVLHDLVHLGLGDPGALHPHRLARPHRQEQPV